MTEHQILFKADMVRAILDGRKTQTRRIFKPRPGVLPKCPYGVPGDLLWVRETWSAPRLWDKTKPSEIAVGVHVEYVATEPAICLPMGKLRPSIFMPRWASRITLEVKDVRRERLQEISERDARAEGCKPSKYRDSGTIALTSATVFRHLWNSINAKKHPWESNPMVWVVDFEVRQ